MSLKLQPGVAVVLGAQWGDEGKGKLIDLLAADADCVCRCQGGNNAGHTIVVGSVKYDFHLLPSGIINKSCSNVIGNGVVIHLPGLFDEIEKNAARGGMDDWSERLRVSDRAHLVFDMHQSIDGVQESRKGANKLGTTKRGIGPAYMSKVSRTGIRVHHLVNDFDDFQERFLKLVGDARGHYGDAIEIDTDAELARYREFAEKLRPLVVDTLPFVHGQWQSGKRILIEGANATMLDIDFGTYPYVTSSNCTVGGVCTGLGLPPRAISNVYGVVKAYTTRVGTGAFPTELLDETGTRLQDIGAEFGTTTGRRRRCGWLDMVVVKFAQLINGIDYIALTKLDVLDTFEEVKICVGYELDGKALEGMPADEAVLARVTPVYETLPGWQTPTTEVRSWAALPENARRYIDAIERHGILVGWVGVGPSRDAMVPRESK